MKKNVNDFFFFVELARVEPEQTVNRKKNRLRLGFFFRELCVAFIENWNSRSTFVLLVSGPRTSLISSAPASTSLSQHKLPNSLEC